MKEKKRYLAALLCTAGLLCLFLPVSTGMGGLSAPGLIAIWKREALVYRVPGQIQEAMAVVLCMCAAILFLAGAAPAALYSKRRPGLLLAALLSLASAGCLLAAVWMSAGGIQMPGIGGVAMILCSLGAGILSALEALKGEEGQDWQPEQSGGTGQDRQAGQSGVSEPESGEPQVFTRGCISIQCAPFGGGSIFLEHMKPVTIGLDPSCCNLVVQGEGISRCHCTVTYNGVSETYLLLDTSTNGTYLDGGQRVPRSFAMELQPGIGFYLARQENRFGLGEPGVAEHG